MKDLETLLYIFHTVGALAGIVLWVFFIARAADLDAISLYSLDRKMPTPSTAFVNQGTNAVTRVLSAQIKMTPDCVFPFLQESVKSHPSDLDKWLTDNGLTGLERSAFIATNLGLHMEAWNQDHSSLALPLDTDLGLSPTHYTPVCRCMSTVLDKYKGMATPSFDDASKALNACLATRQHIPKQTLLFHSSKEDNKISSRKCFSRSAPLLMISLAIGANLFYRRIDMGKTFCNGITEYIILMLVVLCMFALPTANTALDPSALMSIQAATFLPGLVILLGVEAVWWLNGKSIKRVIYPHPFFFHVTLSSLYTIALVENGVYTQDTLFSFYWLSLAVSCVYTSIVFNSTHDATALERSKIGHFLLISVVALTMVVKVIPTFPVSSELNVLWLLPLIYAGIVIAGVVFVELYLGREGIKRENDYTKAAYFIQAGIFLVALTLIWYYSAQLAYISTGDTMYLNTDLLTTKLNFEVSEAGNPHYLTPKAALGQIDSI